MIKIAILASHNGSGFNALYEAIKKNILQATINIVISNNTNAKVLQSAQEKNINNFIVNNKTCDNVDEKLYELLQKHQCNYIFLSGYMKKISAKLSDSFTIINSHPALLPKYGGLGMYGKFVHEAVIKNKEKISGVTIHEVNENYDEGKILLQKELPIATNETADSLEEKIKKLEQKAIVEAFIALLHPCK